MKLYQDFLTYSSPIAIIIGLALGVFYFTKLKATDKLITYYLAISLFIDLLSRILGSLESNNLILWPIMALVELILFSLFFIQQIKSGKWLWILSFLGSIYILFELIQIKSHQVSFFQSYAKIVSSFIIVAIALKLLFQLITESSKTLRAYSLNLVIIGYFSLSIILLLPINFLVNEESNFTLYSWFFFLTITVLFYACLSRHLWKNGRIQTQ